MIVPSIYPNTKALIFDLDGTLANSIPIHNYCWEETCRPFGYAFDKKMFQKMTGMPTKAFAEFIIRESGCNYSVEDLSKRKQFLFHERIHLVKPFEIMAEFVKMNFHKIPMSIGTGGSRKSATLTLETIGLLPYFPVIVTADDVLHHKPDPETFLRCSELMGIPPSECQVFEDGEKGIEAALKAGMMITDVRSFL